MPMYPLKVCCEPGCPTLSNKTRCPVHEAAYNKRRHKRDNLNRGSGSARGYDHRWTKWRAGVIAEYRLFFCGDAPPGAPDDGASVCKAHGRQRPGVTLDHIKRVAGSGDPDFFNPQNVRLLCKDCDQARRGRQSHEPQPPPAPPRDRGFTIA